MQKSKFKDQKENRSIRIFLTGGGTGGSVSPLLAVKKELEEEGGNWEFLWIGTKNGVEQEMVSEENGLKFRSITGGKLRRYFSWQNFVDPFKIIAGFFQSFFLLLFHRPRLIISAGSFVSVPLVWAAWVLRVPAWIHQQDVRPGLANKLMAPFARKITVTFESSLSDYGKKAEWVGNPIKIDLDQEIEDDFFQIKPDIPVILVVGGGTGARAINDLVKANLEKLLATGQVVHITGRDKKEIKNRPGYCAFEFVDHDLMLEALRRAQVVVSRAGLGFLTELSYLAKPSILIPMPDSHQEDNAREFQKKEAALVLDQKKLSGKDLVKNIEKVIKDRALAKKLSSNIQTMIKPNAAQRMAKIIKDVVDN